MMREQSANVVRGRHCVYQTAYHLVFVTYRRKKLLNDEISTLIINSVKNILNLWDGDLLEAKADVDHIHLLVSIPPKYSLSACVGTLKQVTAKQVQREFSFLKELPQNGRLWGSSFYLATVGETDIDSVTKYIRSQGEIRPRGRPRKK